MSTLICTLLGHDLAGIVASHGKFGARRCHRCHQAIGGVVIQGSPRVLYAEAVREEPKPEPKSPIWWLQGVHKGKRAAQR